MAKTLEEEKEKRIFKMKEKCKKYLAIATLFLSLATLLFAVGLFIPSETLRQYMILWAPLLFFDLALASFFVFLADMTSKRIEQLKVEKC